MSLSLKAVDRLFERMALTYGKQFTDMYSNLDHSSVKTMWAHELSIYANSLHRIAWALENLPARCPNVIEFKQLCRQSPAPDVPALPEPKADPERLRKELSKLSEIRAKLEAEGKVDHKAWAKRILGRHKDGININPTTLRFAKEALRFRED
jgi:hypothetical protein